MIPEPAQVALRDQHADWRAAIHEGGELDCWVSHACGSGFDNPERIVAGVNGDGEAASGPLANAWHLNKFLDAATDGTVQEIQRIQRQARKHGHTARPRGGAEITEGLDQAEGHGWPDGQ